MMDAAADIVPEVIDELKPWVESLIVLGIGFAFGLAAVAVLRLLVRRVLKRRRPTLANSLQVRCASATLFLLPVLGAYLALPAAPAAERPWVAPLLVSLTIFGFGWLLARLVKVTEDVLMARVRVDVVDNLAARRTRTQFQILRRVVSLAIFVLAASAVLMQFEAFREFGAGILASAGVAGIVLGFAAQRTLGNLIAGFQIAIAQPVRLGDQITVADDQFGRVEEITLTNVIVHLVDDRRMVLPIMWFVENPFVNWTRSSADIMRDVFLHVDFTTPLERLRAELKRLVEPHPDWDGRVCELIVFDATAFNMQLRVRVSGRDAPSSWQLSHEVREGLIAYLQANYPFALPRAREQSVKPDG